MRPWRFVVLTRSEAKEKLAQAMAAEWRRNLEMDGQEPDVVQTRLRKSQQRIAASPVQQALLIRRAIWWRGDGHPAFN